MGKKNTTSNGKTTTKGRYGAVSGGGGKSSKGTSSASFNMADYQYPILVVLIGVACGFLH